MTKKIELRDHIHDWCSECKHDLTYYTDTSGKEQHEHPCDTCSVMVPMPTNYERGK